MVAAIECYFDPVADRRIRRLWDALEAAGVPTLREHTHRRHRPHVSLVAAPQLDPDAVAGALADLVVPARIRLSFECVGQFARGVLWLGPAPTRDLLAHQAVVTERLATAGVEISELYHPGRWVPHCTLSMTARGGLAAVAAPLCLDIVPVEATLVGAAVVDHTRGLYRPLGPGSGPRPEPGSGGAAPDPRPAPEPRIVPGAAAGAADAPERG